MKFNKLILSFLCFGAFVMTAFAQEIEQIIPQAIEPAPFDKEYKTIKYNRLIPLLVECIKEQQKQIDELKSLHKL